MSEVEKSLLNLQHQVTDRYSPTIIRISGWATSRLKDKSLNEISKIVLGRLKTRINVEGTLNEGRTIFVANHPSWRLDPFVLVATAGENASRLRMIGREEFLAIVPDYLKPHMIPVGIKYDQSRYDGLKRIDKIGGKMIEKALPSGSLLEMIKRNRVALIIAAKFVASGDNVAVFEPEDKRWSSGIGFLSEKVLTELRKGEDAYIQFVSFDGDGNYGNKLFTPKNVTVHVSPPISLRGVADGLDGNISRKILTQEIEGRYASISFGKNDK